ncbi:alpha/beta hydrolase [Streptomyces sudanensis]|uniref:alpha/beta fold hydrolase n=1 Tax=Streptomyces sudanensis TaxID=436397 RepID=UPI0020CCCAA0|nr:alpha/beta hydrolase [Streptomyces sudanensis]MCP9987629.1 alpha/beta hydrolase [Streptomyces sudanensis]
MVRRIDLTGADGVRLAVWEFADPPEGPDGGTAPAGSVLLLHGLTGRASHWADTARRLSGRYRVVAPDQRGHGHGGGPAAGPPAREAYVADAAAVIERLGLAPVTLVGHAMGALTGWQLAAERPDLVGALVIGDMRASALGAASQREWEEWVRTWPLPFATRADARKWFGEDDPRIERPDPARGAFFAEAMDESPDGWRPVFSPERMLEVRSTWAHDAHWDTLARVACPTLVVRGLDGELGRAEAHEMVRVLPRGRYAEVPDAGHYLHYDQPEAWCEVLRSFLDRTAPTA